MARLGIPLNHERTAKQLSEERRVGGPQRHRCAEASQTDPPGAAPDMARPMPL
jgi:hypothetical protein